MELGGKRGVAGWWVVGAAMIAETDRQLRKLTNSREVEKDNVQFPPSPPPLISIETS